MKILCVNFKPDLSYFEKRGFKFDVEYVEDNGQFPLMFLYKGTGQNGESFDLYTPWIHPYLAAKYPNYEHAIILYGYKSNDARLKNTGGYTYHTPLPSGAFWATVRMDGNESAYAVHELHHALCNIITVKLKMGGGIDYMDWTPVNGNWNDMRPYYLNFYPEDPNSNHAVTWNNIKRFIPQLQAIQYYKKMSSTYKYFSTKEVAKFQLEPKLWEILDEAREASNTPYILTSGKRTVAQNNAVKGTKNSAHLRGLAADIKCTDNFTRTKILSGLYKVLPKYPMFIEVAKSHIHVDIDGNIHTLGQTMVSDDD